MNKYYPTDTTITKNYKNATGSKKPVNEEEIDLDDMLSTSTYIYLEDH